MDLSDEAVERAAIICRDTYCDMVPGKKRWAELSDEERQTDIVCLRTAVSALAAPADDRCYCWCVDCGVRLKREEIIGWGCPKCGGRGTPCGPTKDLLVQVNWHELHILCCFAERWAQFCAEKNDPQSKGMPRTVYAIARRLEAQFPALHALTLSGEIATLPDELRERGISDGKIETNVPAAKPFLTLGPGAVGFSRLQPAAEPAEAE